MPVWKNVESPMQATTVLSWPLRANALLSPWPTENAVGQVLGVERLVAAEGVTTDVADDDGVLALGRLVKKAAVRTAGAECGRTGNDELGIALYAARFFAEQRLADNVGVQFVDGGDLVLADAVDTGRLDLVFHVRVELLDHVHRLDAGAKPADQVDGQRVGESQLEIRHGVAEHLFGVLIRDAAGDDADFPAAAVLGAVVLAVVGQLQQPAVALGHLQAVALGRGRHVVELGAVLDIWDGGEGMPFPRLDQRF